MERGTKGVRLINDLRPQKRAGFLGIDLTSKEAKPSACLGLDSELNLIYRGLLKGSDILQVVSRYGFELIAIDAPLSLPKGLCCLEAGCPCQPTSGVKGRNCERELARSGIPCYFTTKKTFIRELIYRGIRLKTEPESQGYKVIEVYPYGSKIRLFGKNIPKKTTPAGLAFLKQRICQLLPNITAYIDGFNHDMCDATIAAYTAFLCSQGKAELCGEPGEGTICLPLLDRAAHDH